MDKYISTESFMKAYEEEQGRPGPCSFEKLLKSVPAADVVPVVHAEWDYEPTHDCPLAPYSTCGNCGMYVMAWNYCPHCGAKMDGGNHG